MISQITNGLSITVETFYQPEYSNPANGESMFAYRIGIENSNSFAVQLISRHWFIFDSNGTRREVQGEGVVGVQPVIRPGDRYEYTSGCNLQSEIGRMHGNFEMLNLQTNYTFLATIPQFVMVAPFKLN